MSSSTPTNQEKTRKTPEEIRADRIAAVTDTKLRQDLNELVRAREAALAETRETQKQNYDKHVAEIREQKMNSANGPQLTPPGMQTRSYFGVGGYERATMDAKAEVLRQYQNGLKNVALPYNQQIDHHLDAHERDHAETRHETPTPEKAPRRLVKFEDRFPDEIKREITR